LLFIGFHCYSNFYGETEKERSSKPRPKSVWSILDDDQKKQHFVNSGYFDNSEALIASTPISSFLHLIQPLIPGADYPYLFFSN
jgi:hypothetical protein